MPRDLHDPQSANESVDPSAASPEEAGIEAPNAEPGCAHMEPGSMNVTGDFRPIEEVTLSELIMSWLRAPRPTWRRLRVAMNAPAGDRPQASVTPSAFAIHSSATAERGVIAPAALRSLPRSLRKADTIQLLLHATAIVCALIGSVIVRGTDDVARADGFSLSVGGPYLWLGFIIWLTAEFVGQGRQLTDYWRGLDRSARLRWAARMLPILIWFSALHSLTASMTALPESATDLALMAVGQIALGSLIWIMIEFAHWQRRRRRISTQGEAPLLLDRHEPIATKVSRSRKLLIALASSCSLLVWTHTSGNRIEPPIILLWLISVALWALVFASQGWNLFTWASAQTDAIRRMRWREYRGTLFALALVMVLGAAFRFNELDTYPPQMYSDLVEKIQDAYKIRHLDDYRIFFANTGGREPLHFYLLSILASQPGMEFNHYALKLMSAIESFITLPIVFWLGVEVIGRRRRSFGLLFGTLVAALLAVSFWHVVIGRQGMRISLAPLFSALTAVYLVRALRHNRRSDFVKAGIALGFGLLGYQAVRMLPLAAVAGVATVMVVSAHTWRARVRYAANLAVLAFVALMVFLPLLHYWTEEPENYMRRTTTRIFGDSQTTADERAAFLAGSAPALMNNIRKTALMFHYHGDSTWVSGLVDEPAMDPVSAALMFLGLAAWPAMIMKTRDPAVFFVPIYLAATLLPTTLALSFPIEVPSFIRASGAIPPAYLIAALPVAVFCWRLCKILSGRAGKVLAATFLCVLLMAANHYNTSLYFGEFTDNFVRAAHPQAQAGKILRGFAESDGAYGNAFVLNSAHWWDVRAIGVEAGMMFWDSGGDVTTVPSMIELGLWREEPFRLDPERDLLFFYARHNEQAPELLSRWFPNGRQMEIVVQPAHKSFYIFRAPALGADGLLRFLNENR